MKDILWYVENFGDKTFAELPLGAVDGLIFSSLCYLIYSRVPKAEGSIGVGLDELIGSRTLKQAMQEGGISYRAVEGKKNYRMLLAMSGSARYGEMRIRMYRDKLDHVAVEQFAATTFSFPEFDYIAYRGTDQTLIGWKEDFNMAYVDVVPAQEDARAYLEEIADLTTGALYLGGHSKGGNLAYYAACHARQDVVDRIAAVHNFDGPGFREPLALTPEYKRLEGRMLKIIPQDSMIGVMMTNCHSARIIKCRGKSILQHAQFNWRVGKDGEFINLSATTKGSAAFDATIKDWLGMMDEQERKDFVNLVFHILGTDDGVDLPDYIERPVPTLKGLKLRYKALPKEQRQSFKNRMKDYGKLFAANVKAQILAKKESKTEESQ